MLLILLCILAPGQDRQVDFLQLKDAFTSGSITGFSAYLPKEGKISTDLRPVLFERGHLSRSQVLLAFKKLLSLYYIKQGEILNSQSDTNYAWLEISISLTMQHRATGMENRFLYAFYFKLSHGELALNRWVLQDVN